MNFKPLNISLKEMERYITILGKGREEEEGGKEKLRKIEEVPGFYIIDEFLTEEEELQLLNSIDEHEWQQHERDKDRQIQIYGPFLNSRYQIEKTESKVNPMPDYAFSLCKKVEKSINAAKIYPGIGTYKLGEVIHTGLFINRYGPQDHLRFHFDDRAFYKELLIGISLGADCLFSMRRGLVIEDLFVPRRSMYIMSKDARYKFEHGIKRGGILGPQRVSITIRGIK